MDICKGLKDSGNWKPPYCFAYTSPGSGLCCLSRSVVSDLLAFKHCQQH